MLRPATEAAIEERVDQMLEEETAVSSPLEEMEEVVDAIPNDFIREQARSLLGTLGLSAEAAERSTREALLEGAGQIVDTVLDTVVRGILQSVLCFILFLLVSLVLRLATRALDITFHLPVLKQANWLGGAALWGRQGPGAGVPGSMAAGPPGPVGDGGGYRGLPIFSRLWPDG